jgi:aspartyl-tRNA(Asn)/glutamyl-tRNA(Gln) amidotransferase subunit C
MSDFDSSRIRKVAHLARLDLTPAEEEQFATQVGKIVDYFEQLNTIDLTDVAPTARTLDLQNVTRTDDLRQYDNVAGIFKSAPDTEDEFFKVPKILG